MDLRRKVKSSFTGPNFEVLFRRIQKIGSDEALDQIDQTVSVLCKYVPEYRRAKNPEILGEVKLAAEALYVLAAELESRQGVTSEIAPARQRGHY